MSLPEELNLVCQFLISLCTSFQSNVTLISPVLFIILVLAACYFFYLYNRPIPKPKFLTNPNNADISITIPLLVVQDQYNQTHRSILLPINTEVKELKECFLQKRQQWTRQYEKQEELDATAVNGESYCKGVDINIQSPPTVTAEYSGWRVIAELKLGDDFHSANTVSSIEFDRDNKHFATASLSRRIKVFEFASVVNEPTDTHCPVVEMSTQSKLSCLTWNKYTERQIASSEYDGTVTVWDASTRQSVMEYEEHIKRVWSVDFSHTDPSMLISGGDDCKVKVWCTKQEASVINIDMKANVCSVNYNPTSGNFVAVGSADHQIYYYDLRNINQPLHVFSGNRKAVSYVKFLSSTELASASTDSKLQLWDVKEKSPPVRTFRGHVNQKYFVGLSVNSQYIACGSETNEVFVYHKALSKPVATYKFGSSDSGAANDVVDDNDTQSRFVSAVCWKSDCPVVLAGNSRGNIKVLALTA